MEEYENILNNKKLRIYENKDAKQMVATYLIINSLLDPTLMIDRLKHCDETSSLFCNRELLKFIWLKYVSTELPNESNGYKNYNEMNFEEFKNLLLEALEIYNKDLPMTHVPNYENFDILNKNTKNTAAIFNKIKSNEPLNNELSKIVYFEQKNYWHKTLLEKAIGSFNKTGYELIEPLIEKGAKFIKVDSFGNTPLMTVINSVNQNYMNQTIDWLLSQGIDINAKNDSDLNALVYAINNRNYYYIGSLVDHGADINMVVDKNKTALLIAAKNGDGYIVNYLLDKGADPLLNYGNTCSILVYLVKGNNRKLIKRLLKMGVDVNGRCNGRTALMETAYYDDKWVAELLLSKGADIYLKDDKGLTATQIALYNKKYYTLELFEKHIKNLPK